MNFFRKKKRENAPSGVLLVSSGGLGDTVLFSIIINRFYTIAKSNEKITLLLRSDSKKVSFLFHEKISIYTVNYKEFRKKRNYRSKIENELYLLNFRIVVSTDFLRHPKLDEAIIKACDAQKTIAMEARPWGKYNAELSRNRKFFNEIFESGPIHFNKILRWCNFAGSITSEQYPLPKLLIEKGLMPKSNKYNKRTIILNPFSAVREKQISLEVLSQIIDYIGDTYHFVIACAPSDLEKNIEYKNLDHKKDIEFDLSDFETLAPRLRSVRLVISVDTALMHLSIVLGAPTICIASAAYVNEIVPYPETIIPKNAEFVYKSMPCEGCLGDCSLTLENKRFPCINRIPAEEIFKKIDKILKC